MNPALALCGSNPTGEAPYSCALRLDTGVHLATSPRGTKADLATLVDATCRAHGVAPTDLRELRIDLGPGSYTGLRVAVTFARTLADFGALPTLAADTLALLAVAAGPQNAERRVITILDARRERWHRGLLQWRADGTLHHLAPSAALPWDSLLAEIRDDDLLVAPAATAPLLDERFAATGRPSRCRAAADVTAAMLFDDRLPLAHCSPAQLEPRYLMGSYAE